MTVLDLFLLTSNYQLFQIDYFETNKGFLDQICPIYDLFFNFWIVNLLNYWIKKLYFWFNLKR